MSGLAQLQSACGICCSAPFWPPEFERSGTLYRAFMDGPITEPEVMKNTSQTQQVKCTQIGEETRSVPQAGNSRYTQYGAWSPGKAQGLLMWN